MILTLQVQLLVRVHHKNLTSLVGYCDDGRNMGLIYEYMANGNLGTHLQGLFCSLWNLYIIMIHPCLARLMLCLMDSGKSSASIVSWETRLQIATETAQGNIFTILFFNLLIQVKWCNLDEICRIGVSPLWL